MSNSQHTPGPWFMEAEPYDSYYQISDDFSTYLAQVEAWDGDNDEEVMGQARANARLITAAPELLEALRLAQSALNTAPRFRVGDTDSYKIAAVVDRAIAKATTAQEEP